MFLHMSCNFSLFICSSDFFFFNILFSSISFYLSVSLTTISSSLSGIKAETSIPESICLFIAQDRKWEDWDMIFFGGDMKGRTQRDCRNTDTLLFAGFSSSNMSRNMQGKMKTAQTWMNVIRVNLTLVGVITGNFTDINWVRAIKSE